MKISLYIKAYYYDLKHELLHKILLHTSKKYREEYEIFHKEFVDSIRGNFDSGDKIYLQYDRIIE